MRPSICQSCLAYLLKVLNFLHAFAGVSITLYSIWVLGQWKRHNLGERISSSPGLEDVPDEWFPYFLMGIGVLMCFISFTGHVAAEAVNGCCLCFHALLTMVFMLVEGALVGFLLIDKHWNEDLPHDPTGELGRLWKFLIINADLFKWVGLALIVIQALSLLLAVILRAMIATRRDYDSDDDFTVIRQPLLNPSADGQGIHSDLWSHRMRQKYGLNPSEFSYNAVDSKVSPSMNV